MTHIAHPRIVEHGLVDGCPRCEEIAADPFADLDDDNLADLVTRTRLWMEDGASPRSDAELRAMRTVETTLVGAKRLERIGAAA